MASQSWACKINPFGPTSASQQISLSLLTCLVLCFGLVSLSRRGIACIIGSAFGFGFAGFEVCCVVPPVVDGFGGCCFVLLNLGRHAAGQQCAGSAFFSEGRCFLSPGVRDACC